MKRLRQYCHVSILPDGNGRWAQRRGKPRMFGHQAGANNFISLLPDLARLPIDVLSIYLFSTENWRRPASEVDFIFGVVKKGIEHSLSLFMENNIRVQHIGNCEELPPALRQALYSICSETRSNNGLELVIAINYGGRNELVHAIQGMIKKGLPPERVNEQSVRQFLYIPDLPDPDVILRTGGEYRLSNWMTWQTADTPMLILPVLWPDITLDTIHKALWQPREADAN